MINMNDIAKLIKHERIAQNLTRPVLCKRVGISDITLYTFESGKSGMNLNTFISLCNELNLEISITRANDEPKDGGAVASNMALLFDKLDEHGKDIVQTIIDKEIERIRNSKEDAPETKPVILFELAASAGAATPNDLSDYKIENLPADEVGNCEYAVRISGESMEPIIHDGDIVCFYQTTDLSDGDIGIFSVNGEIVCKHYYKDGGNNIYLVSHNEKYKKTNIYLPSESNYTFRPYGRVYGKSADLPEYFLDDLETGSA